MKKLILATGILAVSASLAIAAGSHDGGHGHDAGHMKKQEGHDHVHDHAHGAGQMDMMQIGMPGNTDDVDRLIKVTMMETADGEMLFEPGDLKFTEGETVHFKITNAGEVDHEFVMDTFANNEKHRALMIKFPEMEHDDPNAVRLEPGKKGEVIWKFTNAGSFEFGCLIPGHMEAGMAGPINVKQK